jgi:hypothetical protein
MSIVVFVASTRTGTSTIGGTTAAARIVISGHRGSWIEMTAFIKDLSDYDTGSEALLATTEI